MLARALQLTMVFYVLLASLWVGVLANFSPVVAAIGAVLIVLGTVWLLALQFVVFAWMGRDSAVAWPSFRQLVAAGWEELRCVIRLFGWHQAFRSRALADHLSPATRGRRGVVFIHGFVSNRGLWVDWMRRLRHLEHAYVAVDLEPVLCSIDDYAPIIEAAVRQVTDATGLAPVLVCHSMGGLAARAWLRQQADKTRVAQVVTLGTPHHGTALARLQWWALGRNALEMNRHSAWLLDLAEDEKKKSKEKAISADYTSFVCYYSNSDNIVFPATTGCLPGADNRYVPGVAHVALVCQERVMAESLQLIQSV